MTPRSWWRLVFGTLGFIVWAPLPLAGLPLAALLLVSRPRTRWAWVTAAVSGGLSVGILLSAADMLGRFAAAYVVLVTVAFTTGTLVAPAPVLRQAMRAALLAGLAVAGLAAFVWGPTWWTVLQMQAARQLRHGTQQVLVLLPDTATFADRIIALTSATIPGTLALQAIAGLALAWQWHVVVSDRPLGLPLAPFREFRFGDGWVWGVVAALMVTIVPTLAALKALALNVAVALSALYLLRGVAIVTAFAAVAGVSTGALVVIAVISAVLAVPLLFLVPGLWTLGVTDTWLEFRRRLAARRPTAP